MEVQQMKITIEKDKPIAAAVIDLNKFKKELMVETGDVYRALYGAFKVLMNKEYKNNKEFFEKVFNEIKWNYVFKILNTYPAVNDLEIFVFNCKYEKLPIMKKETADNAGIFTFKTEFYDGEEPIIVTKNLMADPDVWIDMFVSVRVFDPVSESWEKKIISL
jgi:hypothetical protein